MYTLLYHMKNPFKRQILNTDMVFDWKHYPSWIEAIGIIKFLLAFPLHFDDLVTYKQGMELILQELQEVAM